MKVRTVITLEYELYEEGISADTKEEADHVRGALENYVDLIINSDYDIHIRSVEVTEIE